ncbi:hypothetical protein ABPG73_000046 [Tetrahymena malaccensis]
MYNLKTLFFFLSLISISLQICHYARDPLPSAGSCICQQAAYSDNGICKLCPNNSYQSSGSATSVSQCDSCQGNSFYLITKATQLSSAICSNCPNNSMNQNMLSTDTQDISVCSYCGSDTYILIPAVQGQPAVCVLCPNNSTTKQGIAKIPGISQCNTCKPGFYISYPATDTQPAICLPCPANTTNQYMYSNPKNNISDCTLCTKGFYQTSQYNAPLTCQKCPLNSTSNGISQIRSIDLCYCDVNYFMIADSKANISAPTCIPCPNGSGTLTRAFQIEDQSYCDICQAGYYMIQSYQDSTSGSPAKAAQCQKCPNNSFSNPGTSTSLSSCSLCFLNYYMTAASKISNEASCTICPDNTGTMAPQSQPGDSTQSNLYSQGIGNQKCSSCPNNTTILPDQTGCSCNDISSVLKNQQNWVFDVTKTSPIKQIISLHLVKTSLSLQICHYAVQTRPMNNGPCQCVKQSYLNNSNCQYCPNNAISSTGGATQVTQCNTCSDRWFYMSQKATDSAPAICTNCPNNSISNVYQPSDVQDVSICSSCGNDSYIDTAAVQGSSAVCVLCPNNSATLYGISSQGILSCGYCKPGYYISQPGTSSQAAVCSACPANTTNQYANGSAKNNNASDCSMCQQGYYQISQNGAPLVCQKCPANTTTNGRVQVTSVSFCICDVNQYMTATSQSQAQTCVSCPNGSGTMYPPNEVGDESYCDICQAGYYMVQPYQDSAGGSPAKAAQCQKCPNNSFSNAGAYTSVSSCSLCSLNYYMTAASTQSTQASCTICPDNTATMAPQSQPGDSTQCNICLAGYFMTVPFQFASAQQDSIHSYSSIVKISLSTFFFLILLL